MRDKNKFGNNGSGLWVDQLDLRIRFVPRTQAGNPEIDVFLSDNPLQRGYSQFWIIVFLILSSRFLLFGWYIIPYDIIMLTPF